MSAITADVSFLGTVGAVHLGEDDSLAGGGLLAGQGSDLVVDVLDACLGGAVEVHDEGGQDDGGAGRCLPQVLEQAAHSLASRADVEVLHAVIGAGVEREEVGQATRHGGLGLGLDLFDSEAGPTLVLVVLHGAVLARSDHVHGVSAPDEEVVQVLAVAIAIGGAHAVRDGCSEGHEAERDLGCCDDVRLDVLP